MESHNSTIHKIQKIGAISGILSIILYFSVAIIPFLPDTIERLMAFTFPLLWIIAFMGLYDYLKKENFTPTLEIAYLFGIIGASIGCAFLVVQQANFIWHETAMEAANSEELKALYNASFRGANRVQAGLDVVFDIFILISLFFFGVNIAKSSKFNKILGWFGSLLAFMTLVFNLYTFPNPPGDSGLIDLGPFMGIWMLIVFIWFSQILSKMQPQTKEK